jgi:hypothetical protein
VAGGLEPGLADELGPALELGVEFDGVVLGRTEPVGDGPVLGWELG